MQAPREIEVTPNIIKIASLRLMTPLQHSAYADYRLWFQHQRFEEDLALMPNWREAFAKGAFAAIADDPRLAAHNKLAASFKARHGPEAQCPFLPVTPQLYKAFSEGLKCPFSEVTD
eukprot:SAG31_NODE_20670_length_568_cov_0.878465_1_plen_117_part_00